MGRGGTTARAGNDNGLAIIAGSVAAAIFDYFWLSYKGPGYNQAIGYVSSKAGRKVPITLSDYGQMGFSTVLGTYGFMRGGPRSRIPAFAFGMAFTQVLTKFILPASNIARYVVFDVDDSGNLVPSRR